MHLCVFCCIGGLETPGTEPRFGQHSHRRRHRPSRLLHISGMGHNASAGCAEREVLQLLRGAVSRHHLQHNAETKDSFLYREPNNTLCGHFVSLSVGVLFAIRFWREG